MRLSHHGGNCCGINHIFGFGGTDDSSLRQIKRRLTRTKITRGGMHQVKWDGGTLFEEQSGTEPEGKIIEVVLTDRQIQEKPRTCAWLKKFGFKLVHRFDNSTGSMCNVLHYCHSTQPNESSPWQSVTEYQEEPEQEDNAKRVPQVGEVWRINRGDYHNYNRNTHVVIVGPVYSGYIVQPIHWNASMPDTQQVRTNDMSFIRERV